MDKRKRIIISGLLLYTAFATLAHVFYLERTTYIDIAYHVLHFIVFKDLFIQNNRFGAILTQFVPLTAIKMHVPLKYVLLSYSEAFVGLPLLVFFVCVFIFKEMRFALIMILLSVFMVRDTFFWIQSELPQGLTFLVLSFAFVYSRQDKQLIRLWEYLLLIIFSTFLVFFHPLIIFPFLFSVSYCYTRPDKSPGLKKRLFFFAGSFATVFALKKIFVPVPEYDARSMEGLENFIKLFPHYFDIPANKAFIKACMSSYCLLPIGFIVLVGTYIRRRQWKLLALFLIAFWGYFFLVDVSYAGMTVMIFLENLQLPLSLIVIVPLVFDVIWHRTDSRLFLPAMVLILIFRVSDICDAGRVYTKRVHWEQNLIAQTSGLRDKKIILGSGAVPMSTLQYSWASAEEILLLSSLKTSNSARCILIADNLKDHESQTGERSTVITSWSEFNYQQLDKYYFNVTDTSRYVIMDHL